MNAAHALLVGSLLAVSLAADTSGQQIPNDPRGLLAKYQSALSWRGRFSFSLHTETETTGLRGTYAALTDASLRWDGTRLQVLGDLRQFEGENLLGDQMLRELFLNDIGYVATGGYGRPISLVLAYRGTEQRQKMEYRQVSLGQSAALEGLVPGNQHKDLAQLLEESLDLRCREAAEEVEGVSCIVLEGSTPFGRITVWIAPSLGHNATKYVLAKEGDDLFQETPVAQQGIRDAVTEVDSIKFVDIGGTPVPVSGRLKYVVRLKDGRESTTLCTYRREDISLDPDFEAMGAFQPDFPDGTRIAFAGLPPETRYEWRENRIVPVNTGPPVEKPQETPPPPANFGFMDNSRNSAAPARTESTPGPARSPAPLAEKTSFKGLGWALGLLGACLAGGALLVILRRRRRE